MMNFVQKKVLSNLMPDEITKYRHLYFYVSILLKKELVQRINWCPERKLLNCHEASAMVRNPANSPKRPYDLYIVLQFGYGWHIL